MLSDLLPAASAAPACSIFSRELAVRPAGTGLRLDRVFVVATPLPWPKPALKHPLLQPAAQALTGSAVPSRLFAAVPWSDQASVELYERRGLDWVRYGWAFEDEHELTELVAWVADAPLGGLDAQEDEVTEPTFLVCTQGSHDQCCGRYGEDLAGDIERRRSDVVVRRVSHTGGHRFAPTLLALPSGRMWAFVDGPLVDRIVDGAETADDLGDRCRGWLGALGGAPQVAELAARIGHGRPFAMEPVVEAGAEDDDGRRSCSVQLGESVVVVDVWPGRTVPTIACEAPGGLPAKPSTEYAWQTVEPEWS